MSVHVSSLVWKANLPSATMKIVMLKLADCSNEEGGSAWPSVSRIAKECGLSDRGVQKNLKRLRDEGWIEIENKRKTQNGFVNSYQIDIEKLKNTSEPRLSVKGSRVNHVHPTGEPRSPKPSLNRQDNISFKTSFKTFVISDEMTPEKKAVNMWNDFAERHSLSRVQKLTESRKKKLRQRLKDCNGLEGWKAALEIVERSDGLLGKAGGTWKVGFDFLLQESSFTKIMEGFYDSWKSEKTSIMEAGKTALDSLNEKRMNGIRY